MQSKIFKIHLTLFLLLLLSTSYSQNSTLYKKDISIRGKTCELALTIRGKTDYRLQFHQLFPSIDSAQRPLFAGDTINLNEITPDLLKAFIGSSTTFDSIQAPLKRKGGSDSIIKIDSISEKLYVDLKTYLAAFFNDQTAETMGMSEAKYREMELVWNKITIINNRLDSIAAFKHHIGKIKRTVAKVDLMNQLPNKKDTVHHNRKERKKIKAKLYNDEKVKLDKEYNYKYQRLRMTLLRAERRQLGKEYKNIKKQSVQPLIFLSGTAFAFLNKSVNNDSIKSNIMSVGIHVTKNDLLDMDAKITFGQNEDVIKSSDRNVFGSTVLIPGIRRFSFLSSCRWGSLLPNVRQEFLRKFGTSLSFNISQLQWQWSSTDSNKVNGGLPVKVVPVSIDACLNYNWLNEDKDKANFLNNAKLSTDFGISTRTIMGNLGLSSQLTHQFTGSSTQMYFGFMLGFRMQIERITVFYSGVLFPNAFYGNVPGLTGGQIVSNIGLRADIFQYKKSNKTN